jgi:hypothetical protein
VNRLTRVLMTPLGLALVSALPPATLVPLGKYDEALVIPANSPVTFQHFGQYYDSAEFTGRFLLEGTFILDCDYCEPGYKDNQLRLNIIPDAAIAASLPHWKRHDNDIAITITDAGRFIDAISKSTERKALLSGKLTEIRGHAAIIVDRYEAGLECDSANYTARFVAVAKPPRIAKIEPKGDFGCGMI